MGQSSGDRLIFSLSATVDFIDSLEKTIDDLRIFTRRPDIYPFDTVAGELLAKAFALSRSSILLVQRGFPDEAFGLSRSLYECSMYLRYITQQQETRDERARKFLEFGLTSKAFWFDLLDKSSSLTESERQDIQRYKDENRIPDDPKRITQPWSETRKFIEKISEDSHPCDAEDSTKEFRRRDRAIAYTDTSSYVHCTQPGVNVYCLRYREPIVIRRSRNEETNTAFKTCMLIRVHLRALACYCLFGMGVVSLAELKEREHAGSGPLAIVEYEA